MIRATKSYQFKLQRVLTGLALLLSCITVNAAFFDDVDEEIPSGNPDGDALLLRNSISSPDGRFTYLAASEGISIFSRDISTGDLNETSVLNGASYPGGFDNVIVSPEHFAVSPDGNFLYMIGTFGYESSASEGDAPIQSQNTVVKFDRDSETGMLSYNDHVDLGLLFFKSFSNIVLSRDGRSLIFAAANGQQGSTEVYLINTLTMESQFVLEDDQADASVLPGSSSFLRVALSADEQSVYLGGPVTNRSREPVPALSVLDFDRNTNRLSVKQTLVEDYYEGLDTDVDVSSDNVLHGITSINATDDGRFVYTAASIRTAVVNNSSAKEAIGLWRVEADGALSLVRSMDKQELVNDVIGGNRQFSDATDLEFSPNGNHFLYIAEDQFFTGESSLTVFARNSETGLLTYIDDNVGVVDLDGVEDVSLTADGRFANLTQFGNVNRTIVVVDTAVDRTVTLNIIESVDAQTDLSVSLPIAGASLQAIVSNNGPTDDYEVEVLISKSDNLTLTTEDTDCSVLADGNITCRAQNLLVGSQAIFDVAATSSQGSDVNEVTVTASSNKVDLDSSNDTDTVDIIAGPASDDGTDTDTDTGTDTGTNTGAGTDTGTQDIATTSSGSGGCSVGGPRTNYDFSFLILMLVSFGIYFRRTRFVSLRAGSADS